MNKNVVIYTLSSVFSKLIMLAAVPLITHFVQPAEFGKWTLYQSVVTMIVPFLFMGMSTYVAKEYHKNEIKKRDLVGEILSVILFHGIILIPIMTMLWLFDVLDLPYLLSLITGLMFSVLQLVQAINVSNANSKKYALFEVLLPLNFLIFSVIYIGKDSNWLSILLCYLLSQTILFILSLVQLHREGISLFNFEKERYKDIYKFSLPIIPHLMSGAIIAMSDRFYVESIMGEHSLGIYSLSYSLCSSGYILFVAYSKIWARKLYRGNKGDDITSLFGEFFYSSLLISLSLIIVTYIFSVYVFDHVFSDSYVDAKIILIPLMIAICIQGIYSLCSHIIFRACLNKSLMMVTIVSAFINLILNYILVLRIGIYGAILSTAASYVVMLAGVLYFTVKYKLIKIEFKKIYLNC